MQLRCVFASVLHDASFAFLFLPVLLPTSGCVNVCARTDAQK